MPVLRCTSPLLTLAVLIRVCVVILMPVAVYFFERPPWEFALLEASFCLVNSLCLSVETYARHFYVDKDKHAGHHMAARKYGVSAEHATVTYEVTLHSSTHG